MEAGPAWSTGPEGVRAAKRDLRRELLARRGAHRQDPAPATRAARDLAARGGALRDQLVGPPGAPVAAYAALPGEPDPALLLEVLGRPVLLPVLLDDADLGWRPADEDDARQVLGPEVVLACALVLVPALAVDVTGARLGRGGGSYDRVLARCASQGRRAAGGRPSPRTVAVVHDDEVLDRVPVEDHDRRVDAVLAPGRGLVPVRPWPAAPP